MLCHLNGKCVCSANYNHRTIGSFGWWDKKWEHLHSQMMEHICMIWERQRYWDDVKSKDLIIFKQKTSSKLANFDQHKDPVLNPVQSIIFFIWQQNQVWRKEWHKKQQFNDLRKHLYIKYYDIYKIF